MKAGFSVGGTSPLPLPEEIRKIDSYAPGIAISIEGNATKWFNNEWGLTVGARLENKTMTTDRKSTRLNSSHANISYAVFCLKKKKKQNTEPDLYTNTTSS